jgi:hypothetical protein
VAQRVAAFRRFDLDHLGAIVGEDTAGKGTGQQLADFQHPDSVQGAGVFIHDCGLFWKGKRGA